MSHSHTNFLMIGCRSTMQGFEFGAHFLFYVSMIFARYVLFSFGSTRSLLVVVYCNLVKYIFKSVITRALEYGIVNIMLNN